jgi:hypothetical protein
MDGDPTTHIVVHRTEISGCRKKRIMSRSDEEIDDDIDNRWYPYRISYPQPQNLPLQTEHVGPDELLEDPNTLYSKNRNILSA